MGGGVVGLGDVLLGEAEGDAPLADALAYFGPIDVGHGEEFDACRATLLRERNRGRRTGVFAAITVGLVAITIAKRDEQS